MPFRVQVEVFLICLGGLLLGLYLLIRFIRACRAKRRLATEGLFLGLWVVVVLTVCYLLIPCFDPLREVVCHGPRSARSAHSERSVALTFDDGPNEPFTSQILDILKEQGVSATFFVVGKNVERFPAAVERIVREGHAVGNHTWDHRSLIGMGPASIRAEIGEWERAMEAIGLPNARLFRAPHGWKTPLLSLVLREKGYRAIGWTRGVWDSDQPGVAVLYHRLTRRPRNGEIILLHDGADARAGIDRSQTVEVLPRAIQFYRSHGFRFVTLREMLGIS